MQEKLPVATLTVEQGLKAILRYCEGCSSHSALSTVQMLVQDCLFAWKEEREELKSAVEEINSSQR